MAKCDLSNLVDLEMMEIEDSRLYPGSQRMTVLCGAQETPERTKRLEMRQPSQEVLIKVMLVSH